MRVFEWFVIMVVHSLKCGQLSAFAKIDNQKTMFLKALDVLY